MAATNNVYQPQVFRTMGDDWGLLRDAITYSAAISALSKGRQWSLAIDVFNHMCAAVVVVLYCAVMAE